MKSIMRQKLAREDFAEKIRKVSELIQLSRKLKPARADARAAGSESKALESEMHKRRMNGTELG
jgi:hypothetical protein